MLVGCTVVAVVPLQGLEQGVVALGFMVVDLSLAFGFLGPLGFQGLKITRQGSVSISIAELWGWFTQRPQSSSFLGLPY